MVLVGGFFTRFGAFVAHNGIVSVTINIVINKTFATVMGTLSGGVLGPVVG